VPTRAIAEAHGLARGLPVGSIPRADAEMLVGVVGHFFGQTLTASSARTRALLAWTPSGPALIQDILAGAYT
jgi:hypothetical protein